MSPGFLDKSLKDILSPLFKKVITLIIRKPEYEFIELHPILVTSDMNKILLAKSILHWANIEFNVKNENLQNLFVLGQYTIGCNPLIGPMIIEVREEDFENSLELIKTISTTLL